MNYRYNDYDRYTLDEELDSFYHDDGSHSMTRRKELDLRRFSGYDDYTGNLDDYYG